MKLLFVTGRLAAPQVERTVAELSASLPEEKRFEAEVEVVGITVAALIHTGWLKRKLPRERVAGFDRVYVCGWVQGDLDDLTAHYGVPFERGPKDIAELPRLFGHSRTPPDLDAYDIDILAEINHAPKLPLDTIRSIANRYRRDGADVIDVGCIPGHRWDGVGETVAMLVADGNRVSIDSFDRAEVTAALGAGAELVLSCNRSNVDWLGPLAASHDAEVVVIPDDPHELRTLDPTVEQLDTVGCRLRLDAILEPIGFGFAASLARYHTLRNRYPDRAMMMGVGNLTEMTGVDSAGVNMLLAAICQELAIGSVLATEVISWGQTAVREFDIARRHVRHAISEGRVPKHLSDDLVMLRDARLPPATADEIAAIAAAVTDPNYRIVLERDAVSRDSQIHVFNRDGHWTGRDAYELFDAFTAADGSKPLTPDHAFYLGYELSKAVTAMTLGKRYTQDEALSWGFLTIEEPSAFERRHREGRAES